MKPVIQLERTGCDSLKPLAPFVGITRGVKDGVHCHQSFDGLVEDRLGKATY